MKTSPWMTCNVSLQSLVALVYIVSMSTGDASSTGNASSTGWLISSLEACLFYCRGSSVCVSRAVMLRAYSRVSGRAINSVRGL